MVFVGHTQPALDLGHPFDRAEPLLEPRTRGIGDEHRIQAAAVQAS